MIEIPAAEPLNARDAREWMRLAKRGDLEGAWKASDRIRQRTGGRRDWSQPRHLQQVWGGSYLHGRTVLIRCYHGLGDTIQFIRYAPLVRTIAREVIVWAQRPLLPLLRGLPGVDHFIALHDGAPDVDYDVDIEVMELPYAFRTTLSTIPVRVPYLTADPLPLEARRPRVGIVWRGGEWKSGRSIPFRTLAPLLDLDGVFWCALQVDARGDERHPNLTPVDTTGLVRAAQAMRAMDLVITIDSMTAHLAGALAVPVWTLLTHEADWRWMEHRADTPWYPTMRLFRQPSAGDWESVIHGVRSCFLHECPRSDTLPEVDIPARNKI
jgi:hypothetical protein